jgi:hypothetical protein
MRSAVVLLGLLIALPACASDEASAFDQASASDEASASERARLHHAQAPHHNPLDCYCRAQGRMFAPGERVCLRTAEGPKLAECRMEINVMSWSITAAPCPET